MESNFELIFEPQFTKDYRKLKKSIQNLYLTYTEALRTFDVWNS